MSADVQGALEAVRRGDQASFAVVYDGLASPVFGVVLRVVRNRAMAEEVSQEVFLEIWRRADQFDPALGSLRGWAVAMARLRAIDRVRSEQASKNRQVRAAVRAIDLEPVRPEDVVVDRDDGAQASHALSLLPRTQRQALELAFFDGLSYPEIAEHLDVPIGTVKTRIRDGLIKLRRAIGSGVGSTATRTPVS